MRLIITLLFMVLSLQGFVAAAATADMEQAFNLLTSKKFDDKASAITLLADSDDSKTAELLNAILGGKLYYRKKDKRIVYVEKHGSKLLLTDALTGEDLGKVSKRKAKKIGINNKLRIQLKAALASMKLNDPDPRARQQAVEGLIGTATPAMLQRLADMRDRESDAGVKSAIDIVSAFAGLDSANIQTQLDAIAELNGQLNPLVVNKLRQMRDTVKDKSVLAEMDKAIRKIEERAKWFGYLETLFFGLSLGSILALAAIGLAIIVERYAYLTVVGIANRRIWKRILPLVRDGKYEVAGELAAQSNTAMSKILSYGLQRAGTGGSGEDVQLAMEEGVLELIPRLEKRTHYLATFANIATLLGLLGTIMGLTEAFSAVAGAGPAEKANLLSASISVAMNTTAFGLMVAIPLLLAHAFMQTKTGRVVDSLEMATVKLANLMSVDAKSAQGAT